MAPRFGEEPAKTLDKTPCRVILDLRQVFRIESVGVRHLVEAHTRVAVGSRLEIQAADPCVRMVLEIAGVGYGGAGSTLGVG
ncbi:MAG TPA: STAS domain-containing protein [Armatimonadetes bacterium]|jgi:anti-anti-sigma regulatory factor|nr:STAS domain-containing protein [Armatimonadota bacterium]